MAIANLWEQVDAVAFDSTYTAILPQLEELVRQSQHQAARRAQRVIRKYDRAWGMDGPSVELVPEAFTGVDLDGRHIANTLSLAPLYMKQSMIRSRGDEKLALDTGYAYVSSKAATQVNDAGRAADRVTTNAHPRYTYTIRVCSPGACSRCIQLIGMWTSERPFLRHPNCRCKSMPIPGDDVDLADVPKEVADIPWDPKEYFDKLTPEEQARRFTKAGAEAIREGADISRVVNARRGATGISFGQRDDVRKLGRRLQQTNVGTLTNPSWVYQTTELTGKSARRRYKYRDGVRLMPESIIRTWGHDKTLLRDRLRHYGYIV